VSQTLKTPNLQDGYRLFMVPRDGPLPRRRRSRMRSMPSAALEQWVEQKKAPESIVASHATNGAVDRTRPLCPYPQIATYKGSGSIDEAPNFTCK
jgi:feruloyl esterase